MKFLDLNGLKHLLKRLVSYDSSNGIAVKRIEGKPEPGKNNSTLVLGSGINDFNFFTRPNTNWLQSIRDNGKSSILIGNKRYFDEPNAENDGIELISNDDIELYAIGEFNINTNSSVNMFSNGSIYFRTKDKNIVLSGGDYISLLGNTTDTYENRSSIKIDDTVKINTPRIEINTPKGISFFRTTTSDKINIGGTGSNGVISIEGGLNPYTVRFRISSDVSVRLTDIGTDKGFYIFTNLYAKTDYSTDLPANITSTAKEALDTKSVQCLLAELLMKTGLY